MRMFYVDSPFTIGSNADSIVVSYRLGCGEDLMSAACGA